MRPGARRTAWAVLLLLGAAGCASAPLPPVTSGVFAPEPDERRMWAQAEEAQRKLHASGALYEDPELEAYLNAVARKLLPPDVFRAIPFSVRVLSNPVPNASAAPNGAVYIHTGLLARMDNEAQLATLLGHEMTHATHRHAVSDFRQTKSRTAFLATLNTTVGAVPFVGGIAGLVGAVGTGAAISGYSRDQEREADREGLALMVRAGYDPREAPKLFYELEREKEEEGIAESFFYASHPRIQERIDASEALVRSEYAGKAGVVNAEPFRRKTHGLVIHNAHLDLKAGRFAKAERAAAKVVSTRPRDARAHFLVGEIFRQKGGEGDAERAAEAYRKAISLDRRYPEPLRGLGLVHLRRGEKPPCRRAFQGYLSLAPKAADRAFIEEVLEQCR